MRYGAVLLSQLKKRQRRSPSHVRLPAPLRHLECLQRLCIASAEPTLSGKRVLQSILGYLGKEQHLRNIRAILWCRDVVGEPVRVSREKVLDEVGDNWLAL